MDQKKENGERWSQDTGDEKAKDDQKRGKKQKM